MHIPWNDDLERDLDEYEEEEHPPRSPIDKLNMFKDPSKLHEAKTPWIYDWDSALNNLFPKDGSGLPDDPDDGFSLGPPLDKINAWEEDWIYTTYDPEHLDIDDVLDGELEEREYRATTRETVYDPEWLEERDILAQYPQEEVYDACMTLFDRVQYVLDEQGLWEGMQADGSHEGFWDFEGFRVFGGEDKTELVGDEAKIELPGIWKYSQREIYEACQSLVARVGALLYEREAQRAKRNGKRKADGIEEDRDEAGVGAGEEHVEVKKIKIDEQG